jgi:hypothetical protein
MIDPKKAADWDQNCEFMANEVAGAAGRFFDGLLRAGFQREEAFELVRLWLLKTWTNAARRGDGG